MESNIQEKLPDKELELIGSFARKKLTREELYTFSLILCDNEIDRDNEKFTIPALKTLAELFVGKSGIFDHNMSGKDQTARIYSACVVSDPVKKTADGEPYTYIQAKAYMVRTEKNKDLIAEIDAGIKKETSVGCCVRSISCSICGKNIKTEGCEHQKGKQYNGKLCCYLLSEPADAYEWSFVAVPAQRNAGVIKSFDTGKKSITQQELARFAEEYREELREEIVKNAARVLPTMTGETLDSICSAVNLHTLKDMKEAFASKAAENLPLIRQLAPEKEHTASENSEYKI